MSHVNSFVLSRIMVQLTRGGVTRDLFIHFLLLRDISVFVKLYIYIQLNHILIWQVSLQLSCRDTCQIWKWFSMGKLYFDHIEKHNFRKYQMQKNDPDSTPTPVYPIMSHDKIPCGTDGARAFPKPVLGLSTVWCYHDCGIHLRSISKEVYQYKGNDNMFKNYTFKITAVVLGDQWVKEIGVTFELWATVNNFCCVSVCKKTW